ncbi:hypothetical protein [Pedobacter sp. UYP24]
MKEKLLVCCSVDTDETNLSRYSYYALYRFMSIYDYCNFDKYYWPDFFNEKNGTSKYVTVLNDRQGMDISLKPKYIYFFKPNEKLELIKIETVFRRPKLLFMDKNFVDIQNSNGIGFCLADTLLGSFHSNHYPFLIPYCGTLTLTKKAIKTFTAFVTTDDILGLSDFSPIQIDLYNICVKMGLIAAVLKPKYDCAEEQIAVIEERNLERCRLLFTLWQDAIPYLVLQPLTHHYFTYGMRNIRNKPRKMDMNPCSFSYEIPKICFLWKDRKEYFELTYRFKVGKKIMTPSENNTSFFINDETDPIRFYLFQSFSEYQITSFFAERKFKIFILKAHFKFFETYWNWLRSNFDVEYSS